MSRYLDMIDNGCNSAEMKESIINQVTQLKLDEQESLRDHLSEFIGKAYADRRELPFDIAEQLARAKNCMDLGADLARTLRSFANRISHQDSVIQELRTDKNRSVTRESETQDKLNKERAAKSQAQEEGEQWKKWLEEEKEKHGQTNSILDYVTKERNKFRRELRKGTRNRRAKT